jgi:DNA-binding Lrp family transcriptional regulator
MTIIFIMIKCELGKANEVAADLVDNVAGLSEAYSTSGQYDLMTKFHLDPGTDIGSFVTKEVQTRPGIRDTFTVMTFSPFLPVRS